jgi:hypothetical protein
VIRIDAAGKMLALPDAAAIDAASWATWFGASAQSRATDASASDGAGEQEAALMLLLTRNA